MPRSVPCGSGQIARCALQAHPVRVLTALAAGMSAISLSFFFTDAVSIVGNFLLLRIEGVSAAQEALRLSMDHADSSVPDPLVMSAMIFGAGKCMAFGSAATLVAGLTLVTLFRMFHDLKTLRDAVLGPRFMHIDLWSPVDRRRAAMLLHDTEPAAMATGRAAQASRHP